MNRTPLIALLGCTLSLSALAGGIDCDTLPGWSEPVAGYELNLHHVFCGEPGSNGRAKGFHSKPGGEAPSSYLTATPVSPPNAAGVYELKRIELRFDGQTYVKSFSTLFPDHCTSAQVVHSAVYSYTHNQGNCAAVDWATCGPSAPTSGERDAYCVGSDGSAFEVATAPLRSKPERLNTAFPIYRP